MRLTSSILHGTGGSLQGHVAIRTYKAGGSRPATTVCVGMRLGLVGCLGDFARERVRYNEGTERAARLPPLHRHTENPRRCRGFSVCFSVMLRF